MKMTNRQRCVLLVIFAMALMPQLAKAERYALEEPPGNERSDFRVGLRHGVEARFDGATQLQLLRGGTSLAQLELALAPRDEGTPPASLGASLESELYHWRYYHVDGIAFWNARVDASTDALLINVDGRDWTWVQQRVVPHVSVGKAKAQTLSIGLRRFEADAAHPDRLYLGLLRLDGAPATVRGTEIRWKGQHDWPLAILVASTEKELFFLAGQAQWTYEQVKRGRPSTWAAPPLCARCRDPRIGRMSLEWTRSEDSLRLSTHFEATPEVELIAAEGLRLEGYGLGDALVAEGERGATYELSLDDPRAEEIAGAAAEESIDARVQMATGKTVIPQRVDSVLDQGARSWLAERGRATTSMADGETDTTDDLEDELPDHLSPLLLQSWPNPFRDRTTIDVTVPRTMAEAFELTDPLRKHVDPDQAPPFGVNPLVRVRVYNVSGQLIRLLSEEPRGPGRYSIGWDGKDLQGRPVAAGAYYVNVEMGDYNVTQRVLRLRG